MRNTIESGGSGVYGANNVVMAADEDVMLNEDVMVGDGENEVNSYIEMSLGAMTTTTMTTTTTEYPPIVVFPPVSHPSSLPVFHPGGLVQPTCEICFQICKIPVKFTCFPCYHRTKIHCHSIKRFCHNCAYAYLELGRRSNERSVTKKCPYCDVTVVLSKVRSHDGFEKDFFVMSHDTNRYDCINNGCTFQGTQNEINRHLSTCDFTVRRCRGCSENIFQKDMDEHIRQCSGRTQCPECHVYVFDNGFGRHLTETHSLKQCEYCEAIVNENAYQEHLDYECSYQPTQCEYCDCVYRNEDELQHLCTHLNDYQTQDVELIMQSHHLRKQCREIREKINRL